MANHEIVTIEVAPGWIEAFYSGAPRYGVRHRVNPETTEVANHRTAAFKLIKDERGDLGASIRQSPGRYVHTAYPAVVR